ncbi:MAG TPA: class I SAM-dependent methyltransferase [Candidatus Aquicultor sp.]|jgi:SAM-dependent methyltransferase
MGVFNKYSYYYNLLYRDKDYAGEADYIDSLVKEYKPDAKIILDLGCGTGRHAALLTNKGYTIHGVDISEDMLAVANEQADSERLTFTLGDVRSVRLNKVFDVVVSLFHVMSYQVANEDLLNAFATAYNHLDNDGVFIFDCWYGPAVLSDRPVIRTKHLEDEAAEVTRLAEPVMHANEDVVDVNYYVKIRDKQNGTIEELRETHRMRYLFKPEIDLMLERTGFHVEGFFEYMTGDKPSYDTWNVCFVGRRACKR